MYRILLRTVALLTVLFLIFTGLSACAAPTNPSVPVMATPTSNMRGLYLRTGAGGDFPSAPDLTSDELKTELNSVVAFATQNGFNTIYYEAVANAQAMYASRKYPYNNTLYTKDGFFARFGRFDPLAYLIEAATREGIGIAAVFCPFSAAPSIEPPPEKGQLAAKHSQYITAANGALWFDASEEFTQKLVTTAAKELAKKYALSAIVLRDFAYPSADFNLRLNADEKRMLLTQLLTNIGTEVREVRPNIQIGLQSSLMLEHYDTDAIAAPESDYDGSTDFTNWLMSNMADFVVASPTQSVEHGYEREIAALAMLRKSTSKPVYTLNTAERLSQGAGEQRFTDALELESQLYLNYAAGLDGAVLSGYSELSQNLPEAMQSIAASFAAPPELPLGGFDLSYPTEFVITRPSQVVTVYTPTYYIMGLTDGLPVTLNGEEVASNDRTFGTLVQLVQGRNEFTFTSGGQSQTAVINYGSSGSGATATISEPRQSSLFPTREELTAPEATVTLSCIAPSGAEMTAQVDGQSVELTQIAAAEDGVAARFSGTYEVSSQYPSDEVTAASAVVYTMRYGGTTKEYTASGTLFVVGENAPLAIEVTDQRGDTSSVNTTNGFRSNMIGSVEQGARDYIIDRTDSHFRLSCGGWIDRADVAILSGNVTIDADATAGGAPLFSADEHGETYRLNMGGAKPYYLTDLSDEQLTITFYNTSGIAELWDVTDSRLFSTITATHDSTANSTRVTLTLKKPLWGYNVEYHDDEVWVFGKYTPQLSSKPNKPLEGVTIVVDAGHGGNDPGALGVAGELGPAEKQLNYINARFVSARLEELGATVIQTQTDDERLSYARRMDPARDNRADFYICLHHNSIAESADSTNARGVEAYYIEGLSQPFAEVMADEISAATGRKNRGAKFATFRVTQMTHTPSILVELGFVVSPAEYEELCKPLSIYRASVGVCNAVLRTILEANR